MTTFTERRQRVTDTSGVLLLMEISAPSFTGPAYIVNDTRDWVSQGITYVGIPFGFKLPDDTAGQTPRAQLVMANVGTGFSDELERLQPNERVLAKFKITDRHSPDTIAQTLYLPLTNVTVNGTTATAQCSPRGDRQQLIRLRANEFTAPGLIG